MKILVVDDDPSIIELCESGLAIENWEVISAINGEDAIHLVATESPDIVILDILMPGMDGFEICKRLVAEFMVPIIMLSARGDVDDKIKCLNIGADDYMTKPFRLDELAARIKAVLRRHQNYEIFPGNPYVSGDLTIDFQGKRLIYGNKEIEISNTENKILRELVANSGKVLSYDYLLGKIWGSLYKDEREYLHTYVAYLRAKLEHISNHKQIIFSKRNVGYYFIGPGISELPFKEMDTKVGNEKTHSRKR